MHYSRYTQITLDANECQWFTLMFKWSNAEGDRSKAVVGVGKLDLRDSILTGLNSRQESTNWFADKYLQNLAI
jgi:hypothetical protein